MNLYTAVRRAVYSQVWAMLPEKVEAMMSFLALKAQGRDADAATLEKIHANAEMQASRAQKLSGESKGSVVAILPLYGMILNRQVDEISAPPAATLQKFTQTFRAVLNDPNVKAIVIDVDSPGGSVEGVPELAAEIRAGRAQKPIIAVSDCLCASAAYWLAAQCSEIYVSPSSLTGSIGVYMAHEDDSKYLENEGVKITLVKYGENKAAGNPFEPLSDKARADMQYLVDSVGAMFDADVAKGRRVTQKDVRESFGQGKVFGAADAVKLRMADKVGTLDDVLARFGVNRAAPAQSPSAEEPTSRMEKLQERTQPSAEDEGAVKMAAMKRELDLAGV